MAKSDCCLLNAGISCPSHKFFQVVNMFFNAIRKNKILSKISEFTVFNTVKPVLNDHSKIGKTKSLMTNGSLMKVESIADCSKASILQYF